MTFAGTALVLALASGAVALLVRRRLGPSPAGGRALVVALLLMAVLTTVFDNLMIAADLFGYGEEHLLGLRVGQAPVEDYAYPLVALLLLPAVWRLLTERGGRAPGTSHGTSARTDASHGTSGVDGGVRR